MASSTHAGSNSWLRDSFRRAFCLKRASVKTRDLLCTATRLETIQWFFKIRNKLFTLHSADALFSSPLRALWLVERSYERCSITGCIVQHGLGSGHLLLLTWWYIRTVKSSTGHSLTKPLCNTYVDSTGSKQLIVALVGEFWSVRLQNASFVFGKEKRFQEGAGSSICWPRYEDYTLS